MITHFVLCILIHSLNCYLERVKQSNWYAIHTEKPAKSKEKSSHNEFDVPKYNTNRINSVKIKSFDPSAPSEGDNEDVTSNDTIPVSNETEAELTVNETGPGYFDLKDTFSVNTTNDSKKIPKITKDKILHRNNKDTFVHKGNNGVTEEASKSTLVGKDSSNEVQKKKQPDVREVREKTKNIPSISSTSKDMIDFAKLVSTKDNLKTAVEGKIDKSLVNRPSSFEKITEFNISSENVNSNRNSTSMKLQSRFSDPSKIALVYEKLKSQDVNLAKMLKRMERMLRKSRISNHYDRRRIQNLLYEFGHLVSAQGIPKSSEKDVSVLNATEGIKTRLSGIEKRMYVAHGNDILNNITAVLVHLFEKIKNPDGKFNNSVKPIENQRVNHDNEPYAHNGQRLKMANMVSRMKHLENVFQKRLKKEKLGKCKIASSVLDQMTLNGQLEHVRHISRSTVNDMDQCIESCCGNKFCDLVFFEKNVCYGIDCKHEKCLLSPVVKHSTKSSVALLTKRISANVGFTGVPLGSSPMDKCEVQPHIITDSVLGQDGLKGNATVLDHVSDTWSCGMECCKVATCNAAMIQEGVCYIISCLSDGPCFDFERSLGQKTSLAFVRRSKSKAPLLQPSSSLPAMKVKGTQPPATGHVSINAHLEPFSTTQTPSPTSTKLFSSPTLYKKKHTSEQAANKTSLPLTNFNDKDFASKKIPNVINSPNTCVQAYPVSNVTLRAGFSAGDFKFRGNFSDTTTCVDHCCRTNDCNVAFVLQNMCFLVTCSSNKLCKNEPLLSNEFKSALVYVARSRLEADMVKEQLVPTMKRGTSKKSKIDPHKTLKSNRRISNVAATKNECSISFIASNAKFLHGFESGEVVSIGKPKGGVNECISKCCDYNGCNASLAIGEQCFLVKCYSQESCQIVESDSSVGTSITIVNRRAHDNASSFPLPQQPLRKASSLIPASPAKQEISKEVVSNTSATKVKKKPVLPPDDLENSETLKNIQEGLENLMQANDRSNNSEAANFRVAHASSVSEFDGHGPSVKKLAKNIGHSKDAAKNANIFTKKAGDASRVSGSSNSKNQVVDEVKDSQGQKSEVLGKVVTEKPREKTESTSSTLDEVLSRVKNLSIEQEQLKENLPEFSEIIGKIQQNLENRSGQADIATSTGERKDSIFEKNHLNNNASVFGLPKFFEPTKIPAYGVSNIKTKIIPTPKLVQSPKALITTPSLIGLHEITSTDGRAATNAVKGSVSVNRISNITPDIGKEVVMALKSAGLFPLKQKQDHFRANSLNTEAIVQKTSKFSDKSKQTLPGRSSVVPPTQRLLHFLEEQIRLKSAHSRDFDSPKDIAKSGEQQRYSKRIHGLMDEQHTLFKRIKKLESEIHQLKNPNNFHQTKTKSIGTPSSSAVEASHVPITTRKGKHSEDRDLMSGSEKDKELTTQRDNTYLLEQLRSIVRSELVHKNKIVSPTMTELHSTNVKGLIDTKNEQEHKVILEQKLNQLYNHAVTEMEKALESSAKRENKEKGSGSNDLEQGNIKKNHIDLIQRPKTNENFLNSKVLSGKDASALSTRKEKVTLINSSDEMDKHQGPMLSQQTMRSSHKDLELKRIKGPVVDTKKVKGKSRIDVWDGVHKAKDEVSSSSPVVINGTSTCHHGEVQNDVTLKEGIAREGVKDEGIVVDMNECIGRCCGSTSCNVAFMLKDNCFLLPCTEAELCQAVSLPTKSLNTKLAFVRRHNKANVELEIFDKIVKTLGLSSASKLSKSRLDSQVKKSKLPSRMNLAKADSTAKVTRGKDIKKLLGSSFTDDLNNATIQALLNEMNSMTLPTNSKKNNDPALKTVSEKDLQDSAHTEQMALAQPNQTHVLRLQNLPSRPKLCPYSNVEYNTTIKGGLAAAGYKYGGKVTNTNDCVEMCCESDSCNIAFMFLNECFLLVCKSENQCESVPAASTGLNPRIVRLVKNKLEKDKKLKGPDTLLKLALNQKKVSILTSKKMDENGNLKDDSVSTCMKSDPLSNVVPEGGLKHRNYKDFGQVKSVEECVELCCRWPKCSMAFMALDGCFGVSCKNHCRAVPRKDVSFQSTIVYVKRREDVLHWLNTQGSPRSLVPDVGSLTNKKGGSASKLLGVERDQFVQTGKVPKLSARNSVDLPATKSSVNLDQLTSVAPSVTKKSQTSGRLKLPANNNNRAVSDKFSFSNHSNLPLNISEESTISKDKRGDGIKPQINVKAAVEPKFSNRNKNKELCIPGMVEHDVTLGGGIKAGSYTEQGEVLNMHECVELCCKHNRCDVAMLIKGICYTVSCYEQKKCVSVPVRRIQYHPSLVHVRRVKRGMAHDGYYNTGKGNDVSLQEILEDSGEPSRIADESFDNENENHENRKSAMEDELMDLLTEQSLNEHDKSQMQKGKNLKRTILIIIFLIPFPKEVVYSSFL